MKKSKERAGQMKKSKEWINCDRSDCFTNREGKCPVLYDNDFHGRPCPFFKTKLQIKKEEVYCMRRLAELPEDVQRKIQSKYY